MGPTKSGIVAWVKRLSVFNAAVANPARIRFSSCDYDLFKCTVTRYDTSVV